MTSVFREKNADCVHLRTADFSVPHWIINSIRRTIQQYVTSVVVDQTFDVDSAESVALLKALSVPHVKQGYKKYCIVDSTIRQLPIPYLTSRFANLPVFGTEQLRSMVGFESVRVFLLLGSVATQAGNAMPVIQSRRKDGDQPLTLFSRDLVPLVFRSYPDAEMPWQYDASVSADLLADIERIFPYNTPLLTLYDEDQEITALLPLSLKSGRDVASGTPATVRYRWCAHPDIVNDHGIQLIDEETMKVRKTTEGCYSAREVFYLDPSLPGEPREGWHEPSFDMNNTLGIPYGVELVVSSIGKMNADAVFNEACRILRTAVKRTCEELTELSNPCITVEAHTTQRLSVVITSPPAEIRWLSCETVLTTVKNELFLYCIKKDPSVVRDWSGVVINVKVPHRGIDKTHVNITLPDRFGTVADALSAVVQSVSDTLRM